MRKLFALVLGLALLGAVVHAERRTKTISATQASQTVNLERASASISVVNSGANEVYVRVFQEGDTMGDATTADPSVFIAAGASYAFPTLSGEGRYFAVSAICSAGETATVYVTY